MMNTRKRRRGIIASTMALVSAVALTLGGAVVAQADGNDIPTTSDITITKLTTPPTGQGDAATGAQSGTPSGAEPISGVTFTAYAVPVQDSGTDLTAGSNAWQQKISTIDVTTAQSLIGATPTAVHTFDATNASGVATWSDAPRGLYLIRETAAPAGVTPAQDFLVAVPMTDPENRNTWLSTIYVYPKNSKVTVSKAVDESDSVAVGQDVTWTVTADIPRDTAISKYVISDALDSRLTPHSTGSNAPTVGLTGSTGQTITSDDYSVAVSGQNVTVTFTDDGRAKLATAWATDPTAQVTLSIPTTVNSTAKGAQSTTSAAINNTATLSVNDAADITSTPATIKVGDIKIAKTDSSTGDPLTSGAATFSVYRTEDDAKNRVNAISVDGETTFQTSTTDGTVVISGLLFSDWVNGQSVAERSYRSYWVNEVTAPEGYQLLAQPVKVNVTAAGTDVATTTIADAPNSTGFTLPLTGGTGTLILTVLGAGLLVAVLVIARRRRAREDQAA